MTKRVLGVVAVFGVGVGIGCAAAPLVVATASAQQASTLPQWQVTCVDVSALSPGRTAENATEAGMKFGAQRWEPFAGVDKALCFKRPKM
jgi:hypothetical protein